MNIREVTEDDKTKFYTLMREFYFDYSPKEIVLGELATYDEWATGIPEEQILVSGLTRKDLKTLVAVEGDELFGYVTGTVKESDRKKLNREGFIWDLYVANDHRSEGVGRALVDEITKYFEAQGCDHLGLEAFVTNKKAIELYKRLGFIEFEVTMKKKLKF